MKDTKIPAGYREAAAELLYAIPITAHPQFIRYLLFLHLCLNGKEARTEDFYGEDPEDAAKRGNRALGRMVEAKENEVSRSSYAFLGFSAPFPGALTMSGSTSSAIFTCASASRCRRPQMCAACSM